MVKEVGAGGKETGNSEGILAAWGTAGQILLEKHATLLCLD